MSDSNAPFRKPSRFEVKWGPIVQKGGYTQVPNDLLRSIGSLDLKPSESLVLLEILSVGEGFGSAKDIGKWLGLYISTVRKAFRSLEKKGLIYRIREAGEANSFNMVGTYTVVSEIAHKKQGEISERKRELSQLTQTPIAKSDTNKESKDSKIEEGAGYKKFREIGRHLKERESGV